MTILKNINLKVLPNKFEILIHNFHKHSPYLSSKLNPQVPDQWVADKWSWPQGVGQRPVATEGAATGGVLLQPYLHTAARE